MQSTFVKGDIDADGDFDLRDFSGLANCFGQTSPAGRCYPFDFDQDDHIDLSDYAGFHSFLTASP